MKNEVTGPENSVICGVYVPDRVRDEVTKLLNAHGYAVWWEYDGIKVGLMKDGMPP